jgi:hypothetical protein
MRALLAIAFLLAAAPASAASFFSADRSVRAHIDDGEIPGATQESSFLDQLGDFVEAREVSVEHDGVGGYSNQARAEHQSNIGGVGVSLFAFVQGTGTSESGGPDSAGETRLEVDIVLDESESFSLTGDYELELGNGEVALEVQLLGGGVSFVSASNEDLFQDSGTLNFVGTIEPGTYTLAIRLFALGQNFAAGSNLSGGSVRLQNFNLTLAPIPEPGTAGLIAMGIVALGARRRATRATASPPG